MLFGDHLVVIRGGGDLGTGVAYRLHRAGFPLVVLELPAPLTIRRAVALSSAVWDGEVTVEGMTGRLVPGVDAALGVAAAGSVAVLVEETLPSFVRSVVVDARILKRKGAGTISDAPLVVALGPGYVAGIDCHAVVETARGPRLGRVLWTGEAEANTATPGLVGGKSRERVVRSPAQGKVSWNVAIGDRVTAGQLLGSVSGQSVHATTAGVVRGLIHPSVLVSPELKIADIDPRAETSTVEISDKALAIGGGVVEAVLTWISAKR